MFPFSNALAPLRWLTLLLVLVLPTASRAATLPPLGTAANFGVLGASAVTSTGGTVVTGDLGVSPGTSVTGFGPGTVSGTIYTGVGSNAGPAQTDALAAYNNAAGQACDTDLTGQDLGGLTLTPGSYCFTSSAQLTGTLTLDFQNDPGAVFLFQIGSTLTTASNAAVVTTNAAPSCRQVTWQVGSSATLGTGTAFLGNILASESVTATTGASVQGSLYALGGAVTLDTNAVDACQCASDAECIDDGNICTDQTCAPTDLGADAFGCILVNNTAACDDTLFCTTADICGGGTCAGAPLPCGDGNLCTDDSCDEATDACVNDNNVLPCDDTLFCTSGDICGGGTCAGVPVLCGDGNLCTDDSCDEATDACLNVNNILPCDDTLFCTNGDICGGGVCAGVPLLCGDGNLCTDDSCDEATDACLNVNNILPCDDTLFCTSGDICGGGVCAGVPLECGDGNLCTDDSCNETTDACVNVNNILPCDDTLFCTTADTCGGGLCAGVPLLCGDGNLCTDDSCDEATDACLNVNNILPCDDTLFCTSGDICAAGLCAGVPLECNDGNLCTNDSCNETTDACVTVDNTLPCNDGLFCTTGDICAGGACSGPALDCSDANLCTTDSCNETSDACVNVNNVVPCNDGLFCTTGDVCGSGTCTGLPRSCDDASACTADSCNELADTCVNVGESCGNGVVDSSCGETCDAPGTEVCNNGTDDDGDGIADCLDPDCLVPGAGSCNLCQLQPPCIAILGDPAEVFVSPMDPRALRIGGTFRFHGRAIPTTDVVPEDEVFAMMLSNAEGIIFRAELPAGALRRKDGRRWVYKNKDTAALLRDGGVSTLYLRTRRFHGELAYAVRIRIFADLSRATVPRMTTQLYLGDDVAFTTADWTLRNGRWMLHERDY